MYYRIIWLRSSCVLTFLLQNAREICRFPDMSENSPYVIPTDSTILKKNHADLAPMFLKKLGFWKKAFWISGAIMISMPAYRILRTVVGMENAFTSLGSSGIGDPGALSAFIGDVLIATAASVVIGLPAMIFFFVSIIKCLSYKSKLRVLLTS